MKLTNMAAGSALIVMVDSVPAVAERKSWRPHMAYVKRLLFISVILLASLSPSQMTVLTMKGLPGPLVLAVAVSPGGSDTMFETSVIGAINRQIKVLTPEPLTNNIRGGVYVGDLGEGRGFGATVWNFLWEGDEVHYDPHRYQIKLLLMEEQ